jgi:cytochrome c-type biogenesis protein CcmH
MKNFVFLLMLLAAPVLYGVGPARAQAAPVGDTFSNPATEDRARNLQRQLRCLVCQGESIDESGAPLAAELRHVVRQQIADGRSDQQIEDFLKTRYGNFILMKPPLQADTYFLWLAPFLVLIGAGAVAMFVVRKARRAVADLPPDLL